VALKALNHCELKEYLIMKACPKCKSLSRKRMMRRGFPRLISGAKAYACDKCNTQYTWFPYLNFSLKR